VSFSLRKEERVLSLIAEFNLVLRNQSMPQLIVRRIEDQVVRKLKEQAGQHGVSMEEEHRRILRHALLGTSTRRPSFKEALLAMPDAGEDRDFERGPQMARPVEVEL